MTAATQPLLSPTRRTSGEAAWPVQLGDTFHDNGEVYRVIAVDTRSLTCEVLLRPGPEPVITLAGHPRYDPGSGAWVDSGGAR